jgi:C1A family cysteine protease
MQEKCQPDDNTSDHTKHFIVDGARTCNWANCKIETFFDFLKDGPVAVGIDMANFPNPILYRGGVVKYKCSMSIHAVNLVGYEGDANNGIFILKNSWGASWGEGSYFKI